MEAGLGGPGGWPDWPDDNFDFLKYDKPLNFSTSAAWLDYDGDGRLDLFVCNYVAWWPKKEEPAAPTPPPARPSVMRIRRLQRLHTTRLS